ncbi:cysteine desulfurase [Bifidobacterium pullorum]
MVPVADRTSSDCMMEGKGMVDFDAIRAEFPILDQTIHGHPLVYLDSAATAQKPQCVIDAESSFYRRDNAAVHRGAHELAARSTVAFERARASMARLVGACADEGGEEIVVTSGATAGLNLLATAFGNASLGRGGAAAQQFALHPGDEIVVSKAEHHSVLLPFQELAARTGATLKWLDLDEEGRIRSDTADEVITERTRVVAVTHVANVTGAITDLTPIIRRAHAVGALIVLDACQSVPHLAVDFHAMDVDFAVWSAHKMYGPTGVGFLYGRRELLEALPPANFGGSMVELAWMDRPAQYMAPPAKFEAGTQPVAQVVAAGAAAEWMMAIGMDAIEEHEHAVAAELLKLGETDGVRILGPRGNTDRIGTVAFDVAGVHPHDVGQFIDAQGIAIRVGHHCAQPVHRHFGIYASNRASSGVYNTVADARALVDAVGKVRAFFRV